MKKAILIISILALWITACGPSDTDLAAVDYTPVSRGDWPVSIPAEQGLDPDLVPDDNPAMYRSTVKNT